MRRPVVLAAAVLTTMSVSCSDPPNSAGTTTATFTEEASQAEPPRTPVFDQTGGCNEATFWAVNDDQTVGLDVRTIVPIDRAKVVEVDLAKPGETFVELQRGTSLRMSLCGDVTVVGTYQLTSAVRAVSGTATFSFGVGRSGCADGGYDGTAELSDVKFIDGTHIDSLVVSSSTIGCFV